MSEGTKLFDAQKEIESLKIKVASLQQDHVNLKVSILHIQNDFINQQKFGTSINPYYWAAFDKDNK